MTSDPLFPPSHLYSDINVLAPCFHTLLLVLLYCLEYSRVMALGICFLSTQIVPPCVLTVPHLCFVPHLGTHVETVYESICPLDCVLLEGRKLCLYLCAHGTQ